MSTTAASPLSAIELPSQVRWRLVALLMAISFLNHFNRISMPVAGKGLIAEGTFSETQMGIIYSALLYAYTLCMTPGGWFSDATGGRVALSVVGIGSGVCAMLTGLTLGSGWAALQMLTVLLLVRGMMGACIAPIYPGSGAVVSQWIPFRQRAWAMALIVGAAPLGIATTFLVFPWLLERLGRYPAFVLVGAVTLAIALVWLWYSRSTPAQHAGVNSAERSLISTTDETVSNDGNQAPTSRTENGQWSSLLKSRSLWLITLSYGTLGYMEYLQFYWSDYYFSEVLQLKGRSALLSAMAPPLLMGVCMPLGGWLSDRLMPVLGYRRSRAMVAGLGMVGSAVTLCLATFLTNPVLIVAGFAVSLGLIGMSEGPSWATAIDLGKQRGGTSAGIFNTGGNGVGALAPFITPWFKAWLVSTLNIGDLAAWGWSLRLGSLICLTGAALWLWIDPAETA